jgi:hypothetical protein
MKYECSVECLLSKLDSYEENQFGYSGILNNDDSEQQQLHLSTNNAISWLNNAFQEPEALPFPLTDTSNHQKSLDLITSDIVTRRMEGM